MRPTLGQFIQTRRAELGLTQEELAERVGEGVRQSEISRLEHDRVSLPHRDRLDMLATALEVSLGDLLITTGWMTEDHRATVEAGAESNDTHLAAGIDPGSMQRLTEAVETLAEVKEMVNQTGVLLAEAEETVATVLEAALPGPVPIELPGTAGMSVDGSLPLAASPDGP